MYTCSGGGGGGGIGPRDNPCTDKLAFLFIIIVMEIKATGSGDLKPLFRLGQLIRYKLRNR